MMYQTQNKKHNKKIKTGNMYKLTDFNMSVYKLNSNNIAIPFYIIERNSLFFCINCNIEINIINFWPKESNKQKGAIVLQQNTKYFIPFTILHHTEFEEIA